MKEHKSEEVLTDLLVLIAVAACVMAGLSSVGYKIYLAATQWLLVASVLMLFAIYFQLKK